MGTCMVDHLLGVNLLTEPEYCISRYFSPIYLFLNCAIDLSYLVRISHSWSTEWQFNCMELERLHLIQGRVTPWIGQRISVQHASVRVYWFLFREFREATVSGFPHNVTSSLSPLSSSSPGDILDDLADCIIRTRSHVRMVSRDID